MNTYDAIFEDGVKEGKRKGIKKGIEKGKKEVAVKLIEMGDHTVSQISSITGLSESEVSVLWKSYNKEKGNKEK